MVELSGFGGRVTGRHLRGKSDRATPGRHFELSAINRLAMSRQSQLSSVDSRVTNPVSLEGAKCRDLPVKYHASHVCRCPRLE